MTTSALPASMFEDPQIQECVQQVRNRYGRAGLAVLSELCRRELMAARLSVVDPG
jgi:hypothetical protein